MIRVALADDHPVFREGLQLLLDSTDDIEVVGIAADGEQLLDLIAGTEVDVAVVDIDMPVLDGIGAAVRLAREHPAVGVLALTMHDGPTVVGRALAAGVRGYILKGAGHGAIARAVRAVAEGDTVLGGTVGESVRRRSVAGPASGGMRLPGLSARETEVLELVARGRDNHEIARELFLSVKTVQNNVSALLAKTGARTRAELVARARDAAEPAAERLDRPDR